MRLIVKFSRGPVAGRILLAGLIASLGCLAGSQEARAAVLSGRTGGGEIMTNEKVIELVKKGLRQDIVTRAIQNASRHRFDVSTKGLIQLQEAGVPPEVMQIMMDLDEKQRKTRDRAVRICIQLLRSDVKQEYDGAVRTLVRYGSYAVPLLADNLANDDERIRAGCSEALGRIGDEAALEPLFQRLQDENKFVRARAAKAISLFDDPVAAERLAEGLKMRAISDHDGYALALGYLGDAKYVPQLLGMLKDPGSEADRAAAAYALGLIGRATPEVLKALVEAVLDSTYRELREQGSRALGKFAERLEARERHAAGRALLKALSMYPASASVVALQLRYFPARESVAALIDKMDARNSMLSRASWESLVAMTGEQLPQDPERWRSWWEIAQSQPRWIEFEVVPEEGEGPRTRAEKAEEAKKALEDLKLMDLTAPPPPEEPFAP